MPRFFVRDTFAINDKATFVIAGSVVEGEVAAGMSVTVPFNTSIKMSAKIDRIEVIRRPDGEVVSLCIDCSRPDEATLWEALNLKNRTIEIAQAA